MQGDWEIVEVLDEHEHEGSGDGQYRAKRMVWAKMECVNEAAIEDVNDGDAERPKVPAPLKVGDTLKP